MTVNQILRRGLALGLAIGTAAAAALPAAAASLPSTCTGALTIATTSTGTVKTAGDIEIFQDSGVAGRYSSGPLAGDSFAGAQDIILNTATGQSELHGSYVVSAPGTAGTVTVRYTGHADLTTGRATGNFTANQGTGSLAGFVWVGTISAQLISLTPPTFTSTDSGFCLLPPS
jgi:hypothetical protein